MSSSVQPSPPGSPGVGANRSPRFAGMKSSAATVAAAARERNKARDDSRLAKRKEMLEQKKRDEALADELKRSKMDVIDMCVEDTSLVRITFDVLRPLGFELRCSIAVIVRHTLLNLWVSSSLNSPPPSAAPIIGLQSAR
jgi:hypothetical protein